LLRDRDQIYGEPFPVTVHSMGIHEVLTAPHSQWQNPYCERLIGSIGRGCLDHFIIFNERGLLRTLKSYFEYYERSRTHLSLDKGAPLTRAVHPPENGPASLNCRRWVDFIIDMNDERLEQTLPP
jgi:putative transposase